MKHKNNASMAARHKAQNKNPYKSDINNYIHLSYSEYQIAIHIFSFHISD